MTDIHYDDHLVRILGKCVSYCVAVKCFLLIITAPEFTHKRSILTRLFFKTKALVHSIDLH